MGPTIMLWGGRRAHKSGTVLTLDVHFSDLGVRVRNIFLHMREFPLMRRRFVAGL